MKEMIKVSSIFVLLIMVMSCATTPRTLPEKYNLDNDLERIDQISRFKVSGFEQVDNQSFILRANFKAIRDDYYLVVLRRPIHTLYSNVSIGIEDTASKDRAYSTDRIVSEGRESSTRGHPGTRFHQAPSNIATIASGYDRIVVSGPAGTDYYVIDRIYKLKGKEHAEGIIEWLRNS